MENTATTYALGHSQLELERLGRQAQAFGPFTRRLFEQAGIIPGMRILDVGSGAGDVAFLAAEMVGPDGEVIGVDCAKSAVKWATAGARLRQIGNARFLEGDPAVMEFDRQFDAVIGRFVLMYYSNPANAVQQLARHLRAGGLIIFQEFEMDNMRSLPDAPTFERAAGWMKKTLNATGTRINLGLELYGVFLAAGLPPPSLRMDTLIGGGLKFPYEIVAETIQSLLPKIEELQISTAAEVDPPTLAERIRKEVVASKGVVLSPGLVGAWSRKPA